MIDRLEIMEFSREVGLAPEAVEKDFVLQDCEDFSMILRSVGFLSLA